MTLVTEILAVILIAFVPFDGYVAWRITAVAWARPRIDALTGAALVSIGIFVLASIVAVVCIHAILAAETGAGFLPAGLPALMLGVGLVVVSLPNLYLLRLLRRWDTEANRHRVHRRDSEPHSTTHHRHDDQPRP